jgi:hypothetical protein
MRPIFPLSGTVALATLLALTPPFATPAVSQEVKASRFAMPVAPQQAAMLKREEDLALGQADSALRAMQTLAKTPPEKALADSDARIVAEIRRLVARRQAVRSSSAGQSQSASNSSAALMNATQQMQETQMSFNLQYLMLQSQMQNENRQYSAVSNIMKTKHDTVRNSISNIR